MTEINKYIRDLVNSNDLSRDDVMRAMQIISLGGATPAQISAFFTAYKMKGFKPQELAGAAECIRIKNKPLNYTQKGLYLTLKPEHLDIWFPAALLCSSINIPTYICTPFSNDLNIIQHLGLNLDIDRELAVECLKYAKMCISFPINNQIQRNVHPTLEELEFDNFFEYATALAHPIEPLALIFEAEHSYLETYEQALRINGIDTALVMTEVDNVLIINNEIKSLKGILDLANVDHRDTVIEKMAQIRAICGALDTKYKNEILTRTAILLILSKAASDFKAAYELATEAFKAGKALALIEKLAILTNDLEENEVEA